jgi:RHS repeat-associated protein
VASPLGWHGFSLDEESGFYHVRHRYYDPELGRFTTTDPLGFVDGPNPYQFAHNSPLTFDDPTGQIVVAPLVVFAAEAALAGLTVYLVGDSALDRMDQDSDRTLGQSLFLTTGQAIALGIADNFGITGVFEAGSGVEVITGRELAGWERVGRGSEGLLSLVTSFKVGGRKTTGVKATERQAARAESEVSEILDDADTCVLSCFVPGTLVATEDGARPIEELKIGDKVWALNLESQQNELAEVVRLFERQAPDTWILTVAGGKEIETTDEHPFFVEGKGFTRADQLQIGDRLHTFEGEWIALEAIASRPDPRPVYNFEVAEQHNYYVGAEPVLVHNCGGGKRRREENMGRTPDKYSKTGREVIERMKALGLIRGEGTLERGKASNLEILVDGEWVPLDSTFDMAHLTDAAIWWNYVGQYYGKRHKEVRAFMLRSDNYILQHRSKNRAAGASRRERYLEPGTLPSFVIRD